MNHPTINGHPTTKAAAQAHATGHPVTETIGTPRPATPVESRQH